jgi:hypothetical protein
MASQPHPNVRFKSRQNPTACTTGSTSARGSVSKITKPNGKASWIVANKKQLMDGQSTQATLMRHNHRNKRSKSRNKRSAKSRNKRSAKNQNRREHNMGTCHPTCHPLKQVHCSPVALLATRNIQACLVAVAALSMSRIELQPLQSRSMPVRFVTWPMNETSYLMRCLLAYC